MPVFICYFPGLSFSISFPGYGEAIGAGLYLGFSFLGKISGGGHLVTPCQGECSWEANGEIKARLKGGVRLVVLSPAILKADGRVEADAGVQGDGSCSGWAVHGCAGPVKAVGEIVVYGFFKMKWEKELFGQACLF
jgi:hypothetical protein